MKKEKLNQKQLADKMGISQPQISKYLKLNKHDPRSASIERLFNALGYHPVITFTKVKTDK